MKQNSQRGWVLGAVEAVVALLGGFTRASIDQIVGIVDALPAHEVAGAVRVVVTVSLALAAILVVASPEFVGDWRRLRSRPGRGSHWGGSCWRRLRRSRLWGGSTGGGSTGGGSTGGGSTGGGSHWGGSHWGGSTGGGSSRVRRNKTLCTGGTVTIVGLSPWYLLSTKAREGPYITYETYQKVPADRRL